MSQDYDALFGPAGKSDYAIGDTLTFTEGGQQLTGEILHITAPGQTVTGKDHPTTYEVDCGDGFPHIVYPSQIVQR